MRKVEKDLLQARVKSINSTLGDYAKQTELSGSKLVSIVSATIMDKCQQFIDKVSELSFLKIKERKVNKFNRLLLKRQGNITWFITVPLINLQAGSASPQVASTSVPQAGSSKEDSTAQAASTSSLQTVSPQAASTSSLQTVSSQAISSQAVSSSQAVGIDPQVVSTSASQAGSYWEDGASQAASTFSPQTVSYQAVSSSEAVSADSQVVSTSTSQADSPLEDSTAQAANASPQTHSINSQGAITTLPQAPQTSRQLNSTNTLRDLQEAMHWKIPTLNGSLIYPVNIWPRLKGQYWLKVLTLQLPPGILLT